MCTETMAMSSQVAEGFERDVVAGSTERRVLRRGGRGNGGARRNNDINICRQRDASDTYIPVDQITGTIHDD